MECAISAATSAASNAVGLEASTSGATLCEQGRRFAELLDQPTAGDPSPMTDTYVPMPVAESPGGLTLLNVVEQVRNLALPQPQASPPTPAESASLDDAGPIDMVSDLATVMQQSVAWQTEVLRMSMLGDMVSSMNQGVRTLFQQQG